MNLKKFLFLSITTLLLVNCTKTTEIVNTYTPTAPVSPTTTKTPTPSITPTATITSTPQPHRIIQDYGIERESFPANYNPLTGRAVQDPSLLELPALLISISNIPVSARPQAGVGFAPWIFEYYIGEATTRFLAVFYSDYPRRVPNLLGDCPINEEIFTPSENWVGNRVWLDENENGIQDDWEMGIGGVCVHLYEDEKLLESTSTNSNGYYAFNIPADETAYYIEFETPSGYAQTHPNVGNDDQDSDVEIESKRTTAFLGYEADTSLDLGLILLNKPIATPSPVVTGTPPAWYLPLDVYAGPIRSGRLTYDHVNKMFTNSCLIFASAAADILAQLDPCHLVYGVDTSTPNSALLPVDEMRSIAERQSFNGKAPNYSGNLFSVTLPEIEREAASYLSVYYHEFSQSAWAYDPLSQSYLRYTDNADGTEIFHPATDRLTGRQQSFENVIVLQATHNVFRTNQLDIDLSMSQRGFAYLFRDGQIMKIYWSTNNREWEQKNGLRRPIHFEDVDGNPIALHPGKTWIHLMTPASYLEKVESGEWRMTFVQPHDPPKE
ncbi:MAG: DUF3048 domain-containing protein [Anaerolineae bacterium]|jgi:hypothetical protein|nr:DUF3048 domain-containing protein [Anaerolineae bacterium]MBT7189254.1 DUF3048 domain-containing protein [Anaerolineae bacterium]MBT7990102.1 DUF3048 domain-containing protein [Anaerolineae bacterium]